MSMNEHIINIDGFSDFREDDGNNMDDEKSLHDLMLKDSSLINI